MVGGWGHEERGGVMVEGEVMRKGVESWWEGGAMKGRVGPWGGVEP